MKKVLKFLGLLFVPLLAVCLSSCEQLKGYGIKDEPEEPSVEECLEAAINPAMSTVGEVLAYQNKLINECQIDETFMSFSSAQLTNIATVCINRYGFCNKREIIAEYLANREVYDNLPGSPSQEPNQPIADTPMQPTPPIAVVPPPSTTVTVDSDTINGVPLIIKTKKETTYEKQ